MKRTCEAGITLDSSLEVITLNMRGQVHFNNGYSSITAALTHNPEAENKYGLFFNRSSKLLSPERKKVLDALAKSVGFQFAAEELKKQKGGYKNVEFLYEERGRSDARFGGRRVNSRGIRPVNDKGYGSVSS